MAWPKCVCCVYVCICVWVCTQNTSSGCMNSVWLREKTGFGHDAPRGPLLCVTSVEAETLCWGITSAVSIMEQWSVKRRAWPRCPVCPPTPHPTHHSSPFLLSAPVYPGFCLFTNSCSLTPAVLSIIPLSQLRRNEVQFRTYSSSLPAYHLCLSEGFTLLTHSTIN